MLELRDKSGVEQEDACKGIYYAWLTLARRQATTLCLPREQDIGSGHSAASRTVTQPARK